MSKRSRRQFSLRTAFVLTTLCAALALVWTCRPNPILRLELTQQGTALLNDDEIDLEDLADRMKREARLRKVWLMNPELLITSPSTIPAQQVANVATLSQHAGFGKLAVTVFEE